jgi:hypothetical protein
MQYTLKLSKLKFLKSKLILKKGKTTPPKSNTKWTKRKWRFEDG